MCVRVCQKCSTGCDSLRLCIYHVFVCVCAYVCRRALLGVTSLGYVYIMSVCVSVSVCVF